MSNRKNLNSDHYHESYEAALIQFHELGQEVSWTFPSWKEAQSTRMSFVTYFGAVKRKSRELKGANPAELERANALALYATKTKQTVIPEKNEGERAEGYQLSWSHVNQSPMIHRILRAINPEVLETVRRTRAGLGKVLDQTRTIPSTGIPTSEAIFQIQTALANKEDLTRYLEDSTPTYDQEGRLGPSVRQLADTIISTQGKASEVVAHTGEG